MHRKACFKRKVAPCLGALLFLILLAPRAGNSAEGPVEHVRNMLNRIMAIQNDPKMKGPTHREARRIAIKAVIAENVDMDDMAESALGEHWEKLDSSQRAEFTSIFRDLFQDSYTRLVLNFLKQERIRYLPQERSGGQTVLKTIILRPNEQIPVDYRLANEKGKWLIRDVAIDGVSIVGKYHSSFSRVIGRSSYSSLIEKMRVQQKAVR